MQYQGQTKTNFAVKLKNNKKAKENKKRWVSELARDLVAFGSIPFLLLTVARVSVMKPYYPMQFVISSAFFFAIKIKTGANLHAGLGVILLGFTSLYYGSLFFALLALIVYAGMIISLFYLKNSSKEILIGFLSGATSAVIGYFIVRLIFF